MEISWDKGPSSSPGNQGGQRSTSWLLWELVPTGGGGVDCSGAVGIPTAAALSPSPLGLRLPLQETGLLGWL